MTTYILDPILEKKFQKEAKRRKISLRVIVTTELTRVAETYDNPYEVATPEVIKELEQVVKDWENDIHVSKAYTDVDKMFADILRD